LAFLLLRLMRVVYFEASQSPVAYTNLAFVESEGFFTDISNREWTLMKQISKKRCQNSSYRVRGMSTEVEYYQSRWEPNFSCRFEDSLGDKETDGHKWVCDPHRLREHYDCLVYSVGSNGNFAFENALNQILPNCEIHVFDPADHSYGMKMASLNDTNYHAWGLKGSIPVNLSLFSDCFESKMYLSNVENANMKTIKGIMKNLGHSGRRIDILKIDCEGCEAAIIKDLLEIDVRQILLEVHGVCGLTDELFTSISNSGYVIFHKEPNIQYALGKCVEYSFLRLSKRYFIE
jgi:FkbM family methyltransferase